MHFNILNKIINLSRGEKSWTNCLLNWFKKTKIFKKKKKKIIVCLILTIFWYKLKLKPKYTCVEMTSIEVNNNFEYTEILNYIIEAYK